jgi:hypothetical protein
MMPFSRDGPSGELNCVDMQAMWYESEVANSYYRQGNYRMALKFYNHIEKHFETIYED